MATQRHGGRAVVSPSTRRFSEHLPIEITESKLYQPRVRPGVVSRPELLAELRAARSLPTVAVTAPAGYGKTTLLALWAAADDRPFAWLSLDQHDNDPIVLLTHLAVALDRVSPLPGEVFDALRTGGISVPAVVAARLGSALARLRRPLVLVVDDVHHLHDGASLDALVTLVDHVRDATQVALAGRSMPMPLARSRTQGRALEIGVADLAFDAQGARSLLGAAGVDLPAEDVALVAQRTEGWAAGLYLVALSRNRPGRGLGDRLSDTEDGLVADYLQAELLSRLSDGDLSFLTRTSVLDRLSGPLCDAVLQEAGSALALERLKRDNLFLVPLDGRGEWYRYHSLFRDLLRAKLERDGRQRPGELLRRAAEWCEADGQLEAALHYAQDGGDIDRVARIAVDLAQPLYASGRSATVFDWFDWLDARDAVQAHPAVAALAAYLSALTGRPAAADRWADLAERWASEHSLRRADKDFAMWLTTLRAVMCRRGVEQMFRDLAEGAAFPWAGTAGDTEYPLRLALIGSAHLLRGDTDSAEVLFADATELFESTDRAPARSVLLAYQAVIAMSRGDWSGATAFVDRALWVTRQGRTESHQTSALVFAVAARVALHRGNVTVARTHLSEAQRLRLLLSHASPWYSVGCLVEMAEVAIGLGDPGGARVFVRDADAVLRRRPDLGLLAARANDLRHRAGVLQAASTSTETLTSAELRILPLLVTHLSVAAIADRLFLSRHTVKAQVWSMYRKLGVHSRDAAVARAREIGLLES